VRGEFKNANTQSYLFKGKAVFFKKAAKLKDIDVVIFFSFEKMNSDNNYFKKERDIIEAIIYDHLRKTFVTVNNICTLSTSLDLKFLSIPTKEITFNSMMQRMLQKDSSTIATLFGNNLLSDSSCR
jgi:hypothetical protein